MSRDEEYNYQLYERLKIPKELEEKWRKELEDESNNSMSVFHKID